MMGHLRNEIILDTDQLFSLSGFCMDFVTYIKTSNRGINFEFYTFFLGVKDDKETVEALLSTEAGKRR